MKLFQGDFFFDKFTDQKYRWIRVIDQVEFKVYITQLRVPDPVPRKINVTVFCVPDPPKWETATLTKIGSRTVGTLTDHEKELLCSLGLVAEEWALVGPESIIGAVERANEMHTTTVRYNAFRGSEKWEFGDPYIPKALLRENCPNRLLFLVRWIP